MDSTRRERSDDNTKSEQKKADIDKAKNADKDNSRNQNLNDRGLSYLNTCLTCQATQRLFLSFCWTVESPWYLTPPPPSFRT